MLMPSLEGMLGPADMVVADKIHLFGAIAINADLGIVHHIIDDLRVLIVNLGIPATSSSQSV